jgi:endothelin-converting enzyme
MSYSVCDTPACIHASSEILYSLDPNYKDIDPCTNFEQYVCGGWRDRHDMRPDQGSIFTGTIMAEDAQTQLRHILESQSGIGEFTNAVESASDSDNFRKLKAAYDACMDLSKLKKCGSKPLESILTRIEEIYPSVSQDEPASQDNLTAVILYLIDIGIEALVNPFVSVRNNLKFVWGLYSNLVRAR